MSTNFTMTPFDRRTSKCLKVVRCIFALALTVSEKLTFQIFNLKKVGQGHEEQFSQCCPSLANIEINNISWICQPALSISEIFTFQFFIFKSRSMSWSTIFVMENIKIYKNHPVNFCSRSNSFRNINATISFTYKSRSRLRSTVFAMAPFDVKCQNRLIFAKVWPLRTIVTQRHTDTHTEKRTRSWL